MTTAAPECPTAADPLEEDLARIASVVTAAAASCDDEDRDAFTALLGLTARLRALTADGAAAPADLVEEWRTRLILEDAAGQFSVDGDEVVALAARVRASLLTD